LLEKTGLDFDDPSDEKIDKLLGGVREDLKDKDKMASYTPGSRIEKTLFGDREVRKSYQQYGDEINEIAPFVPAGVATIALASLDLFPGTGGGKSKFVKQLAKNKTAQEVAETLFKVGFKNVDDDIAEQLAKTKKTKEIEKLLAEAAERESRATPATATPNVDSTPAFERGFGETPQQRYKAEQSTIRGENSPAKQMVDKGLDPSDPTDIPAYARRKGDEIADEARRKVELIDKQLAQTPEQTLQEYMFNQRKKLADDIRANPAKKDALIAAYNARIKAAGRLENLDAYRQKLLRDKADLEASITYTKKLQEQAAGAVSKQADDIATDQATRQVTNANVAAEQAARTSPPPGQVVETPPMSPSPEVAANNAYTPSGKTVGDVLLEGAPQGKTRDNLNIFQRLSLDRLFRENVTNPTGEITNKGIAKAQTSQNPIARFFGRAPVGVSREAGASKELLDMRRKFRGTAELGKYYRDRVDQLGKNLSKESKEKVWSTLDPERAREIGRALPTDLTPEELVYQTKLKEVIDATTDGNLQRGLIDYAQATNENYIKRGYSVFEDTSDMAKAYTESRQSMLSQFKGRKGDISEELLEKSITDPGYLVGKKTAESHAAWAMVDYSDNLARAGFVSDVARPGYTQLPNSKLFGKASGKYVPREVAEDFTGFQYNIGVVQAFSDLVSIYDSWGLRRAKKQLLTVFNPAVRLGNQFSNRVIFANMNGINPVQFNMVYKNTAKMKQQGHQFYVEALQNGLMGTDITQADFARRISDTMGDKNMGRKAIEWFQKSYSGADDRARLAAYTIHRQRGYSVEEAARLTQRGFQDYNQVGFLYDLAAKTPIVGNAFVRFAADAMRIAKNAAVDHPLRTAGTLAMWVAFVNGMSVLSGESEMEGETLPDKLMSLLNGESKSEDQKERENRFGSPKIPFTDIALTVQTPYGEINAARFLPFYALNDTGNQAARFLPVEGNPLKPENWNDPLLGMLGQAYTDTDFRGKSIQDPDNVKFADGTSKYEFDPLSDEDKKNNLLRFLFTQNAPVGREIDSLLSASGTELFGGALGSPDEERKDVYGKVRSIPQSIMRALGLKVEQFGPEQVDKTRQSREYFERREAIEKEVAGMTPAEQAAYRRMTGQYKLREQKENPFDPGSFIDKKAPIWDFSEQKWAEYMQYPKLFDLMEKRANIESEANESPLHPLFDRRIPKDFRYQLAQQRSIAPGDDLELFQRMTEDPRWDLYQSVNNEYKEKAKRYYPERDGEFSDEMVKHQDAKFPDKPPLWAQYLEARNRGEKPQWNDEYEAARNEWENAKLNWTNRERAVRGLPPIPAEQWFNETFGYTPDKNSGFGFGFGGGGGRPFESNMMGRLTDFTAGTKRYGNIKPKEVQGLGQLFARLQAGRGGGKRKPPIGASSRGPG
jgi:hypothetical protein